ncbi:hypothetical protein SLS53_001870 [Cytospora paraplurivora]|uniref:Uncharacterized protein n=1 Tax=Cytospora paraplurivora TaxID=2898453 RepID=A0AAN9UM57_9PEZI
MASYGGGGAGGASGSNGAVGGGGGGDGSLNSLLAQLQRQQSHHSQHSSYNENQDPAVVRYQQHQQPPVSQFNPYNGQAPYQYHQAPHLQHQRGDSPAIEDGTSYLPPAAPTPPAGGIFSSHHPPGFATRPSDENEKRTSSLLSLLKFSSDQGGQQSSSQPTPPQAPPADQLHRESLLRHVQNQQASLIHAPAPAGADPSGLLAALMKGKSQDDVAKPEQAPQQQQKQQQQPASNWNAAPPPDNTQRYLLNLLNRPKPSQSDAPADPPAPSEVDQSTDLTHPAANEASVHDFATLERALSDTTNRGGPAVPTSNFNFAAQDSVSPG